MLPPGIEWLVDAHGCAAERLADAELLRGLLLGIVAELDLRVVGEPIVHKFPPPGGVTAILLLAESHLACHTFPEHGYAAFNLYCCRPRPEYAWRQRVGDLLGATEIQVRAVQRGERR